MLKPTLAVNFEAVEKKVEFPLLLSPKLDGIRCIISGGVAYSRNGKAIRNKFVQAMIGDPRYNGLDGELIVGKPTDPNVFQASAAVMSFDQEPDFTFWVFDSYHPTNPFHARLRTAQEVVEANCHVQVLRHYEVFNHQEVKEQAAKLVERGFEGAMLRDPNALYIEGRTRSLMKVKPFKDAEAIVVGVAEEHDGAGNPKNSLGALILQTPDGTMFRCGGGFLKQQREEFWQQDLIGKIVRYKYFEGYDTPRFPSFIGWRHEDDV